MTELPVTVLEDGRGRARDIVVRFGPGSTVADFCRALGSAANPSVEAARLSLGAAGLVAGRTIRVDDLAHGHGGLGDNPTPDEVELAVIGGLCAGTEAPLTPSQPLTIGRGGGCDLPVDDREVSRVHASVTLGPDGPVLQDLHSSNGTTLRGSLVTTPTAVGFEEAIVVGQSVLAVRRRDRQRADVEPTADGRARFNRPPRTTSTRNTPVFNLPAPPTPAPPTHVSIVAALAPLVLGVVIAVVARQATFLLFALFSPVVIGANAWSNRRRVQREHAKAMAEYEQASSSVATRLDRAVRAEELARRLAAPDPAAVLAIARTPTLRLWERRPTDDDFLDMRVGLGDQPSDVQLTGPGADTTPVPTAHLVPVTLDLRSAGVVGIAGPRTEVLAVTRSALTQLAVLHSPDDLQLELLSDGMPDEWEWFKWLPHAEPHAGEPCHRLVGFSSTQRQRRVVELLGVIEQRQGSRRAPGDTAPAGPVVVAVLDGVRRLRSDERVATLLRDGPAVGVYAIGLADDRAGLPAEGRASVIISGTPTQGFRLEMSVGDRSVADALPDGMSSELAEDIARDLAPLFVVSGAGETTRRVPDPPVDELSLLGLLPPSPDAMQARWSRRRGVNAGAAVVGADADGPFEIDLQRDGPHGLVAGATGAGKSELLQTLVAALAVNSPPTDLTFLLVDFKGGSSFRECEQLPHTVGVITNLDGRLVARALDSIQAELRWRQAAFLSVGAKDLDDYIAIGRADRPSIPRLVIVVDELKELVDAYADAVPRLNQTARLGRSLGVHLVLATQKPGSVTGLADLRANTDLRICLRVLDATESQDVVGTPDAARFRKSDPGRALARLGDGRLVAFQSGYLGDPVNPAAADPGTVVVQPFGMADVGDTAGAGPAPVGPWPSTATTALQALVDAARLAADATGVPPLRRPWLPPLPTAVTVDDLEAAMSAGPGGSPGRPPGGPAAVPLGLLDEPGEQRQDPLVVDLASIGNLLVSGPPRSGRTTALRTFAGAVGGRATPGQVHLYAIEGRGRSLADLELLPHCGAVVGTDDVERLDRLLAFLATEIEHRSGAPGTSPTIVVLVDNYEAFFERFAYEDGGRLVERLGGVLSAGPSRGIHTVLTTDRRGLTGRLSVAVEAKLVLRPVDRDDQAGLGLPAGSVDPAMPPGRGYWYAGPTEVQVALLSTAGRGRPSSAPAAPAARPSASSPSPAPISSADELFATLTGETPAAAMPAAAGRPGEAVTAAAPAGMPVSASTDDQAAAIEQLARRPYDVDPTKLPRPVPPMPRSISTAEAERRRTVPRPTGAAVVTPVIGGVSVQPLDVDLSAAGATFVVAGPRGSGRSTALLTIATSLTGTAFLPVCVVTPRRSALEQLGGGDTLRLTDLDTLATDLPAVVEQHAGRLAVVIDDAELLLDNPVSARLDRIVRAAGDRGGVVIIAATTTDLTRRFSGWLFDARQSRTGILLAPAGPADGEVFDVRLPRSLGAGPPPPPGRGLLVVRGEWTPAQVILS
jgi:S-DNA-T family DNA segregation ATPase FtsK/SpoIIIE